MVENQLRPNKIKQENILKLFRDIEKENFINDENKTACYADQDLLISTRRGYLKNLHLAQIISYANISNIDKVLHVGGLTGYLSTIISKMCSEIIVIENEKDNILKINQNIQDNSVNNIKIIHKKLSDGYKEESPYDLIIIDCPIYVLNKDFLDQLKENGGRVVYIEKTSQFISKGYKITKNLKSYSKKYLFDVFSNFSIDNLKEEFKF